MAAKVLIVLTSAELGGAERVVLDVLRGLSGSAYTFHVILPRAGRIAGVLQQLGVGYSVLSFGRSFANLSRSQRLMLGPRQALALSVDLYRYQQSLARVVRQEKPDIVYSHGLKAEFLTALFSLRSRIPVVWHLHTFPPRRGPLGWLHALASLRPRVLIANSAAVAAQVPKLGRGKTRIVYAGVDTQHFRPMPREQAAAALGLTIAPDLRLIGMISVLAPWKGIDVFLRAVAPILTTYPSWRAVIVGDVLYDTAGHADYLAQLRQLTAELQVTERVLFLPFQLDPAPAYSLLDVFVHAAKTPEPFGRVIGEAMSSARAVIASAGGGALEQITPGRDGMLALMNDETSLREAIERLLLDSAGRLQLGQAARRKVETMFSLEQFARGVRDALAAAEAAAPDAAKAA